MKTAIFLFWKFRVSFLRSLLLMSEYRCRWLSTVTRRWKNVSRYFAFCSHSNNCRLIFQTVFHHNFTFYSAIMDTDRMWPCQSDRQYVNILLCHRNSRERKVIWKTFFRRLSIERRYVKSYNELRHLAGKKKEFCAIGDVFLHLSCLSAIETWNAKKRYAETN